MKKLTKVLSLVLVVAMVFGLCVVGAGATYSDSDKITDTYKEAAEIMSDLGVISGTGNNAFNPTGELSRAEAAVILAKVSLGAQAAYIAPNTVSFKDVPTSYWGYKYIEYCVNAGLLSGTGNGNFSPNAKLDGYQWALMLMRARGLNPDDYGISGANWAINTAKVYYAPETKFSNVPISASLMTREAAIQMAYDAAFAAPTGTQQYTVIKTVSGSEPAVVGYYATLGEASAQAALLDALDASAAVYTTGTATSAQSIAVTVFGVTKSASTDVFGRDANKYKAGTAALNTAYGWSAVNGKTVAKAPVLSFTTKNTVSAIKLAVANAGYTFGDKFNLIVNGADAQEITVASLTGTDKFGGNGMLAEVYVNANNQVTKITVIDTFLGQVTINGITKDNATTTTVDERSLTIAVMDSNGRTYTATPTTPGFEAAYTAATTAAAAGKQAVLLITPDNDNQAQTPGKTYYTKTVAVPETKVVTPTSFVANTSFVADGVTYKYSANTAGVVNSFGAQTVVLDQYGYVISASSVAASANYAFIAGAVGTVSTTVLGSTPTAQVLAVLQDGTVGTYTLNLTKKIESGETNYYIGNTKVYPVSSEATETANFVAAIAALKNQVVSYSVSGETITLGGTISVATAVASGATIKNGQTKVALINSGGDVLMNNTTQYVVYNGTTNTAVAYTGNTALPAGLELKNSVVVTGANNIAKVVFTNSTATISVDSKSVVYIDARVVSMSQNADGTIVYNYTGYAADGTTINLTAAAALSTSNIGLYSYNTDNTVGAYIDPDTANDAYLSGAMTVTGSLLKVGSDYYNITADTKTVFIDPTINAVNGSTGLVVLAVVNGQVTTNVAAIYVTSVTPVT